MFGASAVTTVGQTKSHGIHYTPSSLAVFLAQHSLATIKTSGPFRVLDPACGDGELLAAVATLRPGVELFGVDRDAEAIIAAKRNLSEIGAVAEFATADFLDLDETLSTEFFGVSSFDLVITNPPYVRTQVMGAERAQKLAARYKLSGRVDLYQVFAHAVVDFLMPGGILGLLCSNRFLSVKSGQALRTLFTDHLAVRELFDLGDSKLFAAVVLPAIVIAEKLEARSIHLRLRRSYASTSRWAVRADTRAVICSSRSAPASLDRSRSTASASRSNGASSCVAQRQRRPGS